MLIVVGQFDDEGHHVEFDDHQRMVNKEEPWSCLGTRMRNIIHS